MMITAATMIDRILADLMLAMNTQGRIVEDMTSETVTMSTEARDVALRVRLHLQDHAEAYLVTRESILLVVRTSRIRIQAASTRKENPRTEDLVTIQLAYHSVKGLDSRLLR